MKIIIPSHNRPNNILPFSFIPEEYYKDTYIVVRSGEQEKLYAHHKDKVNVLAFDNLTGIHEKRHAIVKHFNGEKIWMIDDDCTLHPASLKQVYRKKIEKTLNVIVMDGSRCVSPHEFTEFISYIDNLLNEHPYGVVRPSIFTREENYWPYKINVWAFTNVFLNLNILDETVLGYNKHRYLEDAYAFLSTIRAGYSTACLSKWMIKTQKPGKPGGLSEQRTANEMSNAARKLYNEFPKYTRLKKGYALSSYHKDSDFDLDSLVVLSIRIPPIKTNSSLHKHLIEV